MTSSIIDKIIPKNIILPEKKEKNEEPKLYGLLLYSNGKQVCGHVFLDIVDKVFHKDFGKASVLYAQYLTSSKAIVYSGNLDMVNTKLNESVNWLKEKMNRSCGGICSLNIKSIQL